MVTVVMLIMTVTVMNSGFSAEMAFTISFGMLVLMKIVCFVLGYFIIRLGYQLILSGVKGDFRFSAALGGAKADLISVSPGLLFVLLGVILIGFAIFVDKPLWLHKGAQQPMIEGDISEDDSYFNQLRDQQADSSGDTTTIEEADEYKSASDP